MFESYILNVHTPSALVKVLNSNETLCEGMPHLGLIPEELNARIIYSECYCFSCATALTLVEMLIPNYAISHGTPHSDPKQERKKYLNHIS
jgi:hypothetical protein